MHSVGNANKATKICRQNGSKRLCWTGQKKIRLPLNNSWLGVLEEKLTASEDRGGEETASTELERKGFKFGMESSTLSEEVSGSTQSLETENKTSKRNVRKNYEKQHADSSEWGEEKKKKTHAHKPQKLHKMVSPKMRSSLRFLIGNHIYTKQDWSEMLWWEWTVADMDMVHAKPMKQ